MESLIPVALYVRTSGRDQEEAFIRAEAQLGKMREHAAENGMAPVSHFVDKHGNREEFDWMMAQATSGTPPFRTILVYSYDRLSRRASELAEIVDELKDKGLELISVKQSRAK